MSHSPTLETLCASYPSHHTLLTTLHTFLAITPPTFIYITDPYTPRITTLAIKQLLDLFSESEPDEKAVYAYASINAVAAFSPRLFFDTALNALAGHSPTWDNACANWSRDDGIKYNESLDGFLWGIKEVHEHLRWNSTGGTAKRDWRKGRAREEDGMQVKMILVVERSERLLPDLVVPLTKLAELTQTPVTTILISSLPWCDTKPLLGAAPDPFYISVGSPSKEATLQILSTSLPFVSPSSSDTGILSRISTESIQSLRVPYLSTLHSVCGPFVSDPDELSYIGAVLWLTFLDELARLSTEDNTVYEEEEGELDITEELKMRLLRAFTPKFHEALDVLYPRLGSAVDFLVSASSSQTVSTLDLTRTEKYVVIASYLASTNPVKSDMRMVYRGSEGERKKRRRRKSSILTSPRKGKDGAAVKIPQRLLGPTTFPLDRMLAILGNLMVEHEEELDFRDEETRERAAEVEVGRVGLLCAITSLTQAHLLTGVWPTYKCAVGYDVVLGLAHDMGVSLGERVWDAA
ncbi:hypothetical protein NEOLEDRAFT_1142998 [Neolentinus lepideus HHB14362 ss-1]|uniref:Origin recognition complex subunit 5 C-terminal domain-containing protein n=1 Tax=Neolentinus lepideus HHB14362 ss-1 TaxID=1314782 RepID=A0A165MTC2_9AGAM|nr:hypothetical protein NEOLEDRAFT_1142998 [Neolentinus lepideus HHB14362 ss-1]